MPLSSNVASSPRPRTWCIALLASLVVATLAACATPRAGEAGGSVDYRGMLASPVRTDQDRRMDESRHPAEFLPFTQVRPGMQALDMAAGGGYTSQLLAIAVGPTGKLWAQSPNPGAAIRKRLDDQPQPNFVLVARPFDDPMPPDAPKLDLITLVLNYHDISYLPVDRAKMNKRLFDALKPGGKLVVVDHAARTGTGISDGRTLHRIEESVVRSEVQAAGFVLDAEGSFLRNPADPRTETSSESKSPTDKFALRFVRPR